MLCHRVIGIVNQPLLERFAGLIESTGRPPYGGQIPPGINKSWVKCDRLAICVRRLIPFTQLFQRVSQIAMRPRILRIQFDGSLIRYDSVVKSILVLEDNTKVVESVRIIRFQLHQLGEPQGRLVKLPRLSQNIAQVIDGRRVFISIGDCPANQLRPFEGISPLMQNHTQ